MAGNRIVDPGFDGAQPVSPVSQYPHVWVLQFGAVTFANSAAVFDLTAAGGSILFQHWTPPGNTGEKFKIGARLRQSGATGYLVIMASADPGSGLSLDGPFLLCRANGNVEHWASQAAGAPFLTETGYDFSGGATVLDSYTIANGVYAHGLIFIGEPGTTGTWYVDDAQVDDGQSLTEKRAIIEAIPENGAPVTYELDVLLAGSGGQVETRLDYPIEFERRYGRNRSAQHVYDGLRPTVDLRFEIPDASDGNALLRAMEWAYRRDARLRLALDGVNGTFRDVRVVSIDWGRPLAGKTFVGMNATVRLEATDLLREFPIVGRTGPYEHVTNAGFERWDSATKPVDWNPLLVASITTSRETATPYEGGSALRITNVSNASNTLQNRHASQFFNLIEGMHYVFGVAYRLETTAAPNAAHKALAGIRHTLTPFYYFSHASQVWEPPGVVGANVDSIAKLDGTQTDDEWLTASQRIPLPLGIPGVAGAARSGLYEVRLRQNGPIGSSVLFDAVSVVGPLPTDLVSLW